MCDVHWQAVHVGARDAEFNPEPGQTFTPRDAVSVSQEEQRPPEPSEPGCTDNPPISGRALERDGTPNTAVTGGQLHAARARGPHTPHCRTQDTSARVEDLGRTYE